MLCQTLGLQKGLGGQTGPNMIEGLAVFPTPNNNATSSHPLVPTYKPSLNVPHAASCLDKVSIQRELLLEKNGGGEEENGS